MWLEWKSKRILKLLCVLIFCCAAISSVYVLYYPQMSWRSSQEWAESRGLYDTLRDGSNISKSRVAAAELRNLSANIPIRTQATDILITIKTSGKFHDSRVDLLLKTWFSLASSHSYFFTDIDDVNLHKKTDNHVINTKCPPTHTRDALCCKMSFEFDFFITSGKRWWCHVDDDTYVNIPALLNLLRQYRHQEDWYIGKTSVLESMKTSLPGSKEKIPFVFATGGAGFCVSRGLALKMVPYATGGKFSSLCAQVRLPDDCTIGIIINLYLHRNLTISPLFWSHLDHLAGIPLLKISQQVSFGYSLHHPQNVVSVPVYNSSHDPTRFLSLHCHLFPTNVSYCPRLATQKVQQ